MDQTKQSYSGYQKNIETSQNHEQYVEKNYKILQNERIQIEKMIHQFETLNAATKNGEINVTSNYYNYIVLLFITILLFFLLIKYSIPMSQRGGGNNKLINNFFNKFLNII